LVPGGEDERLLRRSLGPTAWAVLADVWIDARPDEAGMAVAATCARQVAANLGIGKDTAARALRRLTAAGVLRRRTQGASATGRFTRGTYEVHLSCSPTLTPCRDSADTVRKARPEIVDTEGEVVPVSFAAATVRTPARHRAGVTAGRDPSQLSLLDALLDVDAAEMECSR
jgi:DNA-binding transcriptional MocR family regulator